MAPNSLPMAGQFLVLDDIVTNPSSSTPKRPRTAANRRRSDSKAGVPTRSRSGCVTCRAKHAKCDETKPGCKVCSSKGLKCGGYRRDLRWSTKHEKNDGAIRFMDETPKPPPSTAGASVTSRVSQRQPSPMPATPAASASVGPVPVPAPVPVPVPVSVPVPVPGSDPGDAGWGAFQQFMFGTAPSDSLQPWNGQFYPPFENTNWESFSPQSSFSLPATENQPSPGAFPLAESVVEEVVTEDDAQNFALSPYQNPFDPSFVIPPSVSHIPSRLIDYWFQEVCPVWSAYDSHMNLNRTMATALWPESEAVSTCMQSMSAAFLATKIPYMKQTSISMMKAATKSIKSELAVIKRYPHFETVPMSLLFALFCLGTTICWLDASQLGVPFLREAKALLYRINQQKRTLCEDDHRLLSFFNKSWVYCDMLLAVVTYNDSSNAIEEIDSIDDPSADDSPTAEPVQSDTDEVPHPWTGVSTMASKLFTRAMKLCRNFRHKMKHQKGVTAQDLRIALGQIEEAKEIEEQLLKLEYDTTENMGDTGDQRTPCHHLILVGEAYRLAALLHLYQTFPDLVALRLPKESAAVQNGQVPWDEWIVPLSLRLVKILEQLPPESGSRMVQPLLCITASTGLRLNLPVMPQQQAEASLQQVAASIDPVTSPGSEEDCDISEYISRLSEAEVDTTADPLSALTESCLEVGNARHFVLKRLNILEMVLPPKPIIMAKSLVQAIWQAYDDEPPGSSSVHWVDVMERQNLRSFFG